MRIGLYSPYFPKHLGGGEKYLLDTALALSQYGDISLAVSSENLSKTTERNIFQRYEQFMGQPLTKLKLIASPLGTNVSPLKKLQWTRQFDLLYYLTDGSLFASLAKKNVMHIQTPVIRPPLSVGEQFKKLSWNFVNTNSAFTKSIVEKHWHLAVDAVHYPMIDVDHFKTLAVKTKKQPIILHVGRFFRQLHSKRQDVLVEFFSQLIKQHPKLTKGWQLVLIGSVEDQQYAKEVAQKAKGLPIKIIHEVSRQELDQWYAKASIYWHATGFGVSETEEPAKMEHFGISTVEAMASQAVPVVINKGGQPESLGAELSELLWHDQQTCLAKTAELIKNEGQRLSLGKKAQQRAAEFGPELFKQRIKTMLTQLELL